jgi:hypothetical protein
MAIPSSTWMYCGILSRFEVRAGNTEEKRVYALDLENYMWLCGARLNEEQRNAFRVTLLSIYFPV